jgi:hypothetical protein
MFLYAQKDGYSRVQDGGFGVGIRGVQVAWGVGGRRAWGGESMVGM